ncbi:hypothetical protein RND81_14G137200 [Saponaria officinalis]|uniref:Fatty acid hydroxylase domain-containing protein n=1 Tax=Saponaria officinalis TaxID=3572 RepID=A0AAW1GW10_SAPOF
MEDYTKAFIEVTSFYNNMIVPEKLSAWLPHFLCSWLRSILGALVLYPVTTLLCLNFWKRYSSSTKDGMPSRRAMISDASIALISIPGSMLFSTAFEWMAENGWTRCYPRISDVGWPAYFCHLLIYLSLAEFGIYWSHRLLHQIKFLYKYVHASHHRVSKEVLISPFAGWSGHPLDGALQELPLGLALMIVPMHFTTFMALFLVEAVWGVIIHDRSDAKSWPIMGSDYHTVHTATHYNYGNYTIFMDWLFGTLRHPIHRHHQD